MRKNIIYLTLILCSITFYGQNVENNFFTPNGLLDKVYDNYGTSRNLREIAIIPQKSIADNSLMLSSNLMISAGIFEIYVEEGSGMELNSALHNSRRAVINQVFTDVSNFLESPLKQAGNTNKVKIWIRNFKEISEIIPDRFSYGTSYYNVPKNLDNNASLTDSQLWKIINGGKNPYENLSNKYYNGTPVQFYHAAFSFDFNREWNTDLSSAATLSQLDLYTVVLRELVHALGFNSLINSDGTSKFEQNYQYYSRFDKFLVNSNDLYLISSLNGNNSLTGFDFNANLSDINNCGGIENTCNTINKFKGTNIVKLYTPNCFDTNATLQYIDVECNEELSNEWLMLNNIAEGFTHRYFNEIERQILVDLGYGFGDQFGQNSFLNFYSYNSDVPVNAIVGFNDGLTANSFVFTGHTGAAIELTGLINNDSAINFNFENLKDLYDSSTQLNVNSGTSNIIVNATFNNSGIHLLCYVPYNTLTNKRGNLTYVFVHTRVFCNELNPNSCNYVPNGGFETNIGLPNNVSQFQTNVCDWYGFSTPDYFHVGANNICGIPINVQSNTPNPVNIFTPNSQNAYAGFYINRANFGDGTIDSSEIIFANLNNSLLPNTQYQLSFQVLKSNFFNINAEIQACFVNQENGFPITNIDITTGNFVQPPGSLLIDEDIEVFNSNAWEEVVFSFNTNNNTGYNFLYISGLVDPFGLPENTTMDSAIYCYIDNVVLKPKFNPVLNVPTTICKNAAILDLNTLLTGGAQDGFFSIDGTVLAGTNFNPSSFNVGSHTITYTIPTTVACEEVVVTTTIEITNCYPTSPPPYISQVYDGGGKSKAIEIKNADNTNSIVPGMYYLVWYQGTGLPANLSVPTAWIDLATVTNTIAPNGVKVFRTAAFSSPTYVTNLPANMQQVFNLNGYDGQYDVVIISTKNDASAYVNRIDVLGDNTAQNIFDKLYTQEKYRSLVRVSCMPATRQAPQIIYDEQDWVGFNRFGFGTFGTYDDTFELAQGTLTNGELGRHFSDELRWIGAWDDLGILDPTNESLPDRSRSVVINALYDTSISGNFEACSLVSNVVLNIAELNNVKVQTKVTSTSPINGVLVQNQGSLIQVRDSFYGLQNQQLIVVNGQTSMKHTRETIALNRITDYVYWSSPLSANPMNKKAGQIFTFGTSLGQFNPERFFRFENQNFYDAINYYGDNGSGTDGYDDDAGFNQDIDKIDYLPFSVIPFAMNEVFIPGRGYVCWPPISNYDQFTSYNANYSITFEGEMNNGLVEVPVFRNDSQFGTDSNLVGNPYPSPIDLDKFLHDFHNQTLIKPAAFIWGRFIDDQPLTSNPGPELYDYSEDNFKIYNPDMIIDPSQDPYSNNEFINLSTLASCQSFFVMAKDPDPGLNEPSLDTGLIETLGNVHFKNYMRTTAPNNTFSKVATFSNSQINVSDNEGKIWLNLTDSGGYTVQLGVVFKENGYANYNQNEDIETIQGRKYNFYTQTSSIKDLIIDVQDAFNVTKEIPLGILRLNNSLSQSFEISIPKKEGVFETQTIYLIDSFLGITHNLSQNNYSFSLSQQITEDRFKLVFIENNPVILKTDHQVVCGFNDKGLSLRSLKNNILQVQVFDLENTKGTGYLILDQKNVNALVFENEIDVKHKLICVKLILNDGSEVVKKLAR